MATSTQGSKTSFKVQAGFNQPDITSMKGIHHEGEPTPEAPVGDGLAPETIGANAYDNEKPIVNDMATDTAMVIPVLLRPAETPGEDSFIATAFEAGGYTVSSADDTTVAAGATVGSLPLASVAGMAAGMGIIVVLDDGTHFPVLIGSITGTTVIPTMALPSAPAEGNIVRKAFTITPGKTEEIPDDKLLALLHEDKATKTQYQDCPLTAVGDLDFSPNTKLGVELTFGSSLKTKIDTAMDGVDDFQDGNGALRVWNPICHIADTPSVWTSAITAAYNKVLTATVAFNVTTEQVPGFGDTNCVNNIQGWMQKGAPPMATIEYLYDSTIIDDFQGDNDDKYVSLLQPGKSSTEPTFGLFMPKAHQSEACEPSYYGNNQHQITAKYTSNPSGIDGTTSSDVGNQPWAIVIGDRSEV